MPIYEYKCSACEEQLEVMQKISDPRLTVCPECGGELSKLISNTSFVLKGGGWYADGYSSSGGNGKASPEKKNGKKTEGKTSASDKGSSATAGNNGKGSSSTEKPAKKAAASGA